VLKCNVTFDDLCTQTLNMMCSYFAEKFLHVFLMTYSRTSFSLFDLTEFLII